MHVLAASDAFPLLGWISVFSIFSIVQGPERMTHDRVMPVRTIFRSHRVSSFLVDL
jgi:hypothetical protein